MNKKIIKIDPNKISRFEVIDADGRAIVEWPIDLRVSIQDEGKTLKIFTAQRIKVLKD